MWVRTPGSSHTCTCSRLKIIEYDRYRGTEIRPGHIMYPRICGEMNINRHISPTVYNCRVARRCRARGGGGTLVCGLALHFGVERCHICHKKPSVLRQTSCNFPLGTCLPHGVEYDLTNLVRTYVRTHAEPSPPTALYMCYRS